MLIYVDKYNGMDFGQKLLSSRLVFQCCFYYCIQRKKEKDMKFCLFLLCLSPPSLRSSKKLCDIVFCRCFMIKIKTLIHILSFFFYIEKWFSLHFKNILFRMGFAYMCYIICYVARLNKLIYK